MITMENTRELIDFEHDGKTYRMTSEEIQRYCRLASKEQAFLQSAFSRFSISPRSHHKILTVSRTLADLDQSDCIRTEHLAEALQYRGLLLFP